MDIEYYAAEAAGRRLGHTSSIGNVNALAVKVYLAMQRGVVAIATDGLTHIHTPTHIEETRLLRGLKLAHFFKGTQEIRRATMPSPSTSSRRRGSVA